MCGVVGVRLTTDRYSAADLAYQLLPRLQHRGQDGAGLTVLTSENRFETARGLGLIHTALKEWQSLKKGAAAVAHTRYATTGTGGVGELQPFVKGSPKVALAHNGNIVNTEELALKYKLQLETASDLDVLQQIFLLKEKEGGFKAAVQAVFDEFNGSYAVVGLEEDGTMFGFRDPYGLRPLFLGRGEEAIVLASESCALAPLTQLTEEIKPGEWVRVSPDGRVERGRMGSRRNPEGKTRFCMFELVYFSSPQSEVGNQSVYRSRFKLGEELAQEIRTDIGQGQVPAEHFDFVVPVPETARAAAIAVAERLAVPYREYLVKNPYVPRTFILGRQELRLKALEAKLGLIGPEIRGQKILLVDDSVVRGNTSRLMAMRLREAGAKSVSLASTCPPIRHGCFYGIDFPDAAELVAAGRTTPQIAEAIGVDNLFYISEEGLLRALGGKDFCRACLNGDYPTKDPSFDRFLQARREQRAAE